jgi:hypothetical protein
MHRRKNWTPKAKKMCYFSTVKEGGKAQNADPPIFLPPTMGGKQEMTKK